MTEFQTLEEKREDLRIRVAEIMFGMHSSKTIQLRFFHLLEAIKEFADEEKH